MPPVIAVNRVGKKFQRYHRDRPTALQEVFIRGLRQSRPKGTFWALRGVSFDIHAGQILGVIGPNGAGKSTLLKLLGGICRPDEGTVAMRGRVSGFLNLTAGFQGDLTGRENVHVSGVIGGLTRAEVRQHFDSIVEFAELRDFIDSPLRTYSSGMQMRLAFAVAVHTNPQVLLIDEVLAVGDLAFRGKCLERIQQFKSDGCAIVLVSHDTYQVQQLCDAAIWLRDGQIVHHGEPGIVVAQYTAGVEAETRRRTPADQTPATTPGGQQLRVHENRFGSLELQMTSVKLLDPEGRPVTQFSSGEPLRIEIEYSASRPVESPVFSVWVFREDDQLCCTLNTDAAGAPMPVVNGRGRLALQIDRLDLNGGSYYVDVGVYERDWRHAYDYHARAYPLVVHCGGANEGILYPPCRWEFLEASVPQAADT